MATSSGARKGWKSRRLNLSPHERLWTYIDRSDAKKCWIWPGNKWPNGYGQIYANGRQVSTHRLAWEATNGRVRNGLFVCHKCDNKLCCNPAHLFLGTQSDNILDCVRKKRNNHVKGESHPMARFTEAQIRDIRARYNSGKARKYVLAKEYGVRHGTISKICNMERWVHVK